MHSALPVTQGDSSGYYSPSSSKNKSKLRYCFNRIKIALLYNSKVQYLLGGVLLTFLLINLFLSPSGSSTLSTYSKKGGAPADEFTVAYVSEPYIYPDLTQLEEYRKMRSVKNAKDGRILDSTKHRILYKPSKSAAKLFNAPKYFDHILKTGVNELKDTNPPLVLVLGLDADRYSKDYLANVLADRLAYAKKHNYGLYARYLQDFAPNEKEDPEIEIELDPLEWAKTNLMREAMAAFDKAAWMWWLEQDAVIMDTEFDIGSDLVFDKAKLSKQMIRDAPIIPPESIIHTYKHVRADQIKFITTQNDVGICMSSYLIRNDPLYGRILLDYLRDPLHRKYPGFRSAGSGQAVDAAVTHLVQWHPAILSRMALVPASVLGAPPEDTKLLKTSEYKTGEFVRRLKSSLLEHRGVRDNDYISDEWKTVKASSPSKDAHSAALIAVLTGPAKAKPIKNVATDSKAGAAAGAKAGVGAPGIAKLAPGAAGAPGVVGVAGVADSVGAAGAAGVAGAAGAPGIANLAVGAPGAAAAGVAGAAGAAGVAGVAGVADAIGAPGIVKLAAGAPGAVGVADAAGVVGVADAAGVVGTVAGAKPEL